MAMTISPVYGFQQQTRNGFVVCINEKQKQLKKKTKKWYVVFIPLGCLHTYSFALFRFHPENGKMNGRKIINWKWTVLWYVHTYGKTNQAQEITIPAAARLKTMKALNGKSNFPYDSTARPISALVSLLLLYAQHNSITVMLLKCPIISKLISNFHRKLCSIDLYPVLYKMVAFFGFQLDGILVHPIKNKMPECRQYLFILLLFVLKFKFHFIFGMFWMNSHFIEFYFYSF